MLIKLFKENTTLQLVVIVVLALFYWIRAFAAIPNMPSDAAFGPIYHLFHLCFASLPWLACAVALILTFAEGFWLNLILYNHRMIPQNTCLPTLLYVVMMGMHTEQCTITPMLLINALLIGMLGLILWEGKLQEIKPQRLVGVAVLISLSTLVWMPAVWFLIPLIFIYFVFRLYSWREFGILFLGLLAPYIIVLVVGFMTDTLPAIFSNISHSINNMKIDWGHIEPFTMFGDCWWLLVFLIALLLANSYKGDRSIAFTSNGQTIDAIIIPAFAILFYAPIFPLNAQGFAIPFAFLTSVLFLFSEKPRWFWTILLVVLILVPFLS